MYQCAKCLRHFGGLKGFDDHHEGSYPPADSKGRYAPGKFVCLTDEQLLAKGMIFVPERNTWIREHMPEEKKAQLAAHNARTSSGSKKVSDE
jgi:hypothetical protein